MNLAILYDAKPHFKPSNTAFIHHLLYLATKRGIHCTLINDSHLPVLHQFDGLFIRVTTQRDHYTYDFALEAEHIGIPVLDDTQSIWRCTSKILQRELFLKNKIDYPITRLISLWDHHGFGYPAIVKTPEGCFSQGIYKIDNHNQFNKQILPLLQRKYHYLLMQEYIKTQFDWRIAVLAGQPLFAIKYYILPGDFRIVTPSAECDHETIPLSDVPEKIIDLALRSCKLIGNGFYGVDIKESGDHLFVLEVNDNPSLDRGTEDECEGDTIYHALLDYFC